MNFPVLSRRVLAAIFVGAALLLGVPCGWAGITSFTASPTTFLPGQNVTLSWSVTAGDVLSISPGVGTVTGATGSVTVMPTVQTTYILTDSTSGTTAQAIVTPVTPAALRNRWSFNEPSGTTATDSISGATGTLINATSGTNWTRVNSAGGTTSPDRVRLPGGSSASAPYIDLPNGILTNLTDVTLEGWMTVHGSQSWSRIFDFGTGTANEITAPGGSATGTDYLLLSAQVGGSQATKRLSIRDNNVEQSLDPGDPTTNGTQFHFAVVYDSKGNGGLPQVRYYKNGALITSLNTTFPLASIENVNNWLGRSNWTGDANTNGSYNEFRLWTGALSATAVADSAASGPDALPQAVRIESFTAFPATTIFTGQSTRLSYLLANPSGGAFTASIDQGVGAVTGTSGYVTVTPATTTTYTLTVTAGATTRTAQILVAVIPGAPTAENLAVTTGYQTAKAIALVANDLNTAAGSLVYSIVNPPAHGSLTGSGASRTYTPFAGYSGPDSFTYKANDGTADSNIATVSLTVNPAPVAPSAVTFGEPALYTDYASGSFTGLLQGVDGNPDDTFTFSLVAGTGSTHNAYFTVVGNQLIAAHNFSADVSQTISIRVRVTDSTGNFFEQVITRLVEARPPHVKINEINYNPARNTQLSEFIELYNPTGSAVDLSNWQFVNGVEYLIPPGTTLPAGGYLVIAADPATISALYGITALGPWTGGLSSDGEEIELRDAGGSTVDKVIFGNTAPWPVPPNGEGPSLELLNPAVENNLGGNWRASTATQTAVSYVTPASGSWKYFKGTSEASTPISAWRAEGYNDTAWLTGTMPLGLFKVNSNTAQATLAETGVTLGTQLTDMATFASGTFTAAYRSVFCRKTFTVAGAIPRAVLLRVMHDDAAIVWINGTEVARFGFQPAAPTNPTYDSTAYYERANDPWSDMVLLNAGNLLHAGTNTIAIQGFAKLPQLRTDQEDAGVYNIFDFCVDVELRSAPDILGTPGAQNSTFAANPPPAVRDVDHTPKAPKSWESTLITARVSDPQGVGSVQLKYQLNPPGTYIPSTLPLTVAQILANPLQVPPANPAFENAGNWTTLTMVDNGSVAGDIAGDGIFTARIPAQPHRTLVRYRIVATDISAASVTVPRADDPRKNYAFYVYNAVPIYTAGSQVFAPDTLNTLPVYQWIIRPADMTSLLAYNGADQFSNSPDLNVLLGRHFENFVGTLVVGDQVMDHTRVRLRGGNSRYMGSGKRHFRFNFPKGTALQAADEAGRDYARPWEAMLFNKLFGNKGAYDFGIPYEVGGKLWTQQGIPMPDSHWVHFRVVQNANETDATNGDFWGLYQALELPEGKNFLRGRDLPLGNFYKMTDWQQNGEMDQRYQAAGAPDFGEDFDNVRYNLHQTTSQSDLERYMNMPLWYRFDAVKEAIRHYDIFCEPTGRHRVKNLLWYFAPTAGTNGLGQCVQMPYDWDASFGPNFNNGWDFIHNALYDHANITDSPTWSLPKQSRLTMQIDHRNAIRELRDLVWFRDGTGRGPFDDMVDDALATILQFYPADMARWPVTGAVGQWATGAPAKVQDMKNFAFTGWTDSFGGDAAVPAGGRAAYLDSLSDAVDAGQLPATPVISYTGSGGYPVDALAFTSTAFSDPQGAGTFGAIQWRIGEITDPTAPAYDPTAERIYEAVAVYDSGALPVFSASITIPGSVLRVGHTYRARVRHRDISGRWGHWSAPAQFTAGSSNYIQTLKDNLMVNEIMYRPAPPSAPYLESDYEYLELVNISPSLTLDLTNVRFTKGVDFDFAGSAITSLAPGARVLVVRNAAAFASRYAAGQPIAGEWESGDSLDNGGEQVKLSYGAGAAIHDFTYNNVAPWPTQASIGGYSLVLRAPETRPDHTLAANWRASYVAGGSPGSADRQTYAEWTTANSATGPLDDDDGDGLDNALEYTLGGSNSTADTALLPTATLAPHTVATVTDTYLTLTFRRPFSADQATVGTEWSPDLSAGSWTASGVLVSSTNHGDGSLTEVWRCPTPTSAGRYFGRVKTTVP